MPEEMLVATVSTGLGRRRPGAGKAWPGARFRLAGLSGRRAASKRAPPTTCGGRGAGWEADLCVPAHSSPLLDLLTPLGRRAHPVGRDLEDLALCPALVVGAGVLARHAVDELEVVVRLDVDDSAADR